MTTLTKHTHSIHIDAPVQKVFGWIEVPANYVSVMQALESSALDLAEVTTTPEGTVADYKIKFRELGMHLTATMTREDYVRNERITDHSSLGVFHMMFVEPDDTGTKLTFVWDASKLMKMIDATFYHTDKHIDQALEKIKKEVEALS
ncbi:SRPBCC family protein [Gordonia rhizosphera]|uniref:Polyketide cyclase/dehydrase n=1 Tax=Gordonia rhizosphera NBRC 16068 TaxID=1108045 RepID=K6W3U9_9ACTN|nr:SRPBCC family protein [Gordonia rhizosphera]GAB88391.1 hypothetical protein GORHZ_018_00520 [Gordonia rhizosphera NBRC 16068]